jgi:hypothetical protein
MAGLKGVEYYLALVFLMVRVPAAFLLGLGNDEVYYVMYAQHPSLSYFDHPPLVGILVYLSTLGFKLDTIFAIRFFPLLFSVINLIVIYRIVRSLGGNNAGLIAMLLYMGSVYTSVISGIFIMPDSAMLTFWILFTGLILEGIRRRNFDTIFWVKAGCFVGLGFLSKYHSLFLWLGAGLFFIFYLRKVFYSRGIYIAALVTIIFMFPVLYWNYHNEWLSFTFHFGRVGTSENKFEIKYLLGELFGGLIYNGILNGIIFWMVLFRLFTRKNIIGLREDMAILFLTVPLILFFILSSISKPTLPHWSAPAFTLLIIPAAKMLSRWRYGALLAFYSASLMMLLCLIAPLVINNMRFDYTNRDPKRLGRFDFTLDMYGWEQRGEVASYYLKEQDSLGYKTDSSRMIIFKWFPGAHIERYIARRENMNVFGVGSLDALHHYHWVNSELGEIDKSAYHYIFTSSHFFQNPSERDAFESIDLIAAVPFHKGIHIVENLFIYRVKLKRDYNNIEY